MTSSRRSEVLAAYARHAKRFDAVAAHLSQRPVWRVPEPSFGVSGNRQTQVLSLIARGFSNAEIGAELHLSVETVKSHVRQLLSVLCARNRAHAVAIGLARGLISLPSMCGVSAEPGTAPALGE